MIYEIYIKCHDEKYKPSLPHSKKKKIQDGKPKVRSSTIELSPYHVPEGHYDTKRLAKSLHKLGQHVQKGKENNSNLARKILFAHGKQQTLKFLHRTTQLFGDKIQALRKKKFVASAPDTIRLSYQSCPAPKCNESFVKNEELCFEKFRPDFSIEARKQSFEFRQDRRKTLGIEQADLKNYQNKRLNLPIKMKRKEKKKDQKDFKQINMKGFAAKVSMNLGSKQKINTKTLVRLMNLNVKCLGEERLKHHQYF